MKYLFTWPHHETQILAPKSSIKNKIIDAVQSLPVKPIVRVIADGGKIESAKLNLFSTEWIMELRYLYLYSHSC